MLEPQLQAPKPPQIPHVYGTHAQQNFCGCWDNSIQLNYAFQIIFIRDAKGIDESNEHLLSTKKSLNCCLRHKTNHAK